MISKCIVDDSDGYESRLTIIKSGFNGMAIIIFEDPYYNTELEYRSIKDLSKQYPELKEELEQL